MTATSIPEANKSAWQKWRDAIATYTHPSVITLLFLGFSAGLPFLLIFGTLSFWLARAGVDISVITYFSWAALGYSFKFVWAPLIDRLPFPGLHLLLGRRRSWLLVIQCLVVFAIVQMGMSEPLPDSLERMAVFAVLLGFAAASQDIVIDAYRIEIAQPKYQAAMSAMYIAGYRIGMLVAGAGAFYLVDGFSYAGRILQQFLVFGEGDIVSLLSFSSTQNLYLYQAWRWTYFILAGFMIVGVITTLVVREPKTNKNLLEVNETASDYARFMLFFTLATAGFILAFVYLNPSDLINTMFGYTPETVPLLLKFCEQTLRLVIAIVAAIGNAYGLARIQLVNRDMLEETYINPVRDFFQRYRATFVFVLLLIGFYRVSDIVLGVSAVLFYEHLGFSGVEIANISKTFGLFMTIAGGFLGGLLTARFGVLKILLLGAILAAFTNLLFLWFAYVGNDTYMFIFVIAADNLSAGLAGAAFVAYLSSLTNISFTAMQYAIFSSIMLLVPKLIGGYSGSIVKNVGYEYFFLITTVLGIPVVFLVIYLIVRDRDLRVTD